MNYIINIFVLILLLLGLRLSISFVYFIFGFFPFIKAKELSEKDLGVLKNCGLIHKTSAKGYYGINKDCVIKGTKGKKSYSTHFLKAVYFFSIGHMKDENIKFNQNYKYKYEIIIKNLTEYQLKNLKIRDYDNTIMYKGDFIFEKENLITWKENEVEVLFKERILRYIQLFSSLTDKYSRYLILATLIYCAIIYAIVMSFNKLSIW